MNKERYTLSIKFKERTFCNWDWQINLKTLKELEETTTSLIDNSVLRYAITDNTNNKTIYKDFNHNIVEKTTN